MNAVSFALDLQEALMGQPWPAQLLALEGCKPVWMVPVTNKEENISALSIGRSQQQLHTMHSLERIRKSQSQVSDRFKVNTIDSSVMVNSRGPYTLPQPRMQASNSMAFFQSACHDALTVNRACNREIDAQSLTFGAGISRKSSGSFQEMSSARWSIMHSNVSHGSSFDGPDFPELSITDPMPSVRRDMGQGSETNASRHSSNARSKGKFQQIPMPAAAGVQGNKRALRHSACLGQSAFDLEKASRLSGMQSSLETSRYSMVGNGTFEQDLLQSLGRRQASLNFSRCSSTDHSVPESAFPAALDGMGDRKERKSAASLHGWQRQDLIEIPCASSSVQSWTPVLEKSRSCHGVDDLQPRIQPSILSLQLKPSPRTSLLQDSLLPVPAPLEAPTLPAPDLPGPPTNSHTRFFPTTSQIGSALQIALQLFTSSSQGQVARPSPQLRDHQNRHLQTSSHVVVVAPHGRSIGASNNSPAPTKCTSYREWLALCWTEQKAMPPSYVDIFPDKQYLASATAARVSMPPPQAPFPAEQLEQVAAGELAVKYARSLNVRQESSFTRSEDMVNASLMSNQSLRRRADTARVSALRSSQALPVLSRDRSLENTRLLNAGLDAFGSKNMRPSGLLMWRGLRVRMGLHTGVRFATDLVYSEVRALIRVEDPLLQGSLIINI